LHVVWYTFLEGTLATLLYNVNSALEPCALSFFVNRG
jgi:hypothetical protein